MTAMPILGAGSTGPLPNPILIRRGSSGGDSDSYSADQSDGFDAALATARSRDADRTQETDRTQEANRTQEADRTQEANRAAPLTPRTSQPVPVPREDAAASDDVPADTATANPATANPATANPATANPTTANPATATKAAESTTEGAAAQTKTNGTKITDSKEASDSKPSNRPGHVGRRRHHGTVATAAGDPLAVLPADPTSTMIAAVAAVGAQGGPGTAVPAAGPHPATAGVPIDGLDLAIGAVASVSVAAKPTAPPGAVSVASTPTLGAVPGAPGLSTPTPPKAPGQASSEAPAKASGAAATATTPPTVNAIPATASPALAGTATATIPATPAVRTPGGQAATPPVAATPAVPADNSVAVVLGRSATISPASTPGTAKARATVDGRTSDASAAVEPTAGAAPIATALTSVPTRSAAPTDPQPATANNPDGMNLSAASPGGTSVQPGTVSALSPTPLPAPVPVTSAALAATAGNVGPTGTLGGPPSVHRGASATDAAASAPPDPGQVGNTSEIKAAGQLAAPGQLSGPGQLATAQIQLAVPTPPTVLQGIGDSGQTLATAIPVPVSTQVASQLNEYLLGARSLRDGTHRAVIRLSPEHLGQVTVTLDVHGGSVRMDVLAGPQAIDAMQNDLSDLRNQLAQSGLALDDVSMRQSASAMSGGGPGSPNPQDARPGPDGSGTPGTSVGRVEAVDSIPYRVRPGIAAGQLDVLI